MIQSHGRVWWFLKKLNRISLWPSNFSARCMPQRTENRYSDKYLSTDIHELVLNRFSYVQLSAAPWTVDHQAPLSVGFSRQECWRGFPCPPPGALPDPGIEPMSAVSPALQADYFTAKPPVEPTDIHSSAVYNYQKMKAIQVSLSGWMDKQDVVFPYNGILFRQKSNKVLMYSAMQMDLKNIMLIERSPPKSHINWFHLCEKPRKQISGC